MAILVTVVLWAPDFYLLAHHQWATAVAVLMLMHLAIALVTYNCLVRLSPMPDGTSIATAAGDREPAGLTAAMGTSDAPPAAQVPSERHAASAVHEEETVPS